jgi:Cu/Ag efflux pump CusA
LPSFAEGQRSINLVMRLPLAWRNSAERIAQLPMETDSSRYVPLSAVADVREAKGPNVIFRENGQRRFTIAIKPRAQDVGVLVEELKDAVNDGIELPEGYFVTYEGEFQAQRDATLRIAIMSAAVFLVIVSLLTGYFKSLWLALQVLFNIPLALVGGLVLT